MRALCSAGDVPLLHHRLHSACEPPVDTPPLWGPRPTPALTPSLATQVCCGCLPVRFWMQPNQIVCAWLGMGGHWLAGHLSRMLGQGSREPLLLGMAGLTRTLNLHITLAPTLIEPLLLGGQGWRSRFSSERIWQPMIIPKAGLSRHGSAPRRLTCRVDPVMVLGRTTVAKSSMECRRMLCSC